MRWRRAGAVLVAALLLQGGVALAQPALPREQPASAQALLDAQPEDRRTELLEERMVLLPSAGLPVGQVEALVLFSQPPHKVWELLLLRERQKEYRPELNSISVTERGADELVEEQHLRIAFLSVGYRLRDRFDASTHTITWELEPNLESTPPHVSGYWELHPLAGDRTLARFGTKVSVSPALPGFLQNVITRSNVPESLENTRQWVDSNGLWRP